ncbi:FKBP-type peptidyl-prolyl cis-trans isomerase [Mycoplasma phocimorsus]|uniref:FKBP-type peptidyl-prolyl cis-trans isomerase n=1 Tax=Mycoplasma phocimorsus TaxID=3045839 RepID=UPI0024BF692C|nr:FKBP-type peptidyl-prolyl cis-trans isomerase [Mycoplasma phocimorsus]MDJ1647868.1 FKBP-type peptidyl-prolyl cis-trans isomerase [Mycoplasma phocimorsus]
MKINEESKTLIVNEIIDKEFYQAHVNALKEQIKEIKDEKEQIWIPTINYFILTRGRNLVLKLQQETNKVLFLISEPKIIKASDEEAVIELTFAYQDAKEKLVIDFKATPNEINQDLIDSYVKKDIDTILKTKMKEIILEKASENGDYLEFDFIGKKDGIPFEGGSANNYKLLLGAGQFISSLESQLVGLKAGDEVDLDVDFPADYHSETLAGQKTVFSIKVHKVFKNEQPDFNDEFVKSLAIVNVNTTKDLKELIAKRQKELFLSNEDEIFAKLASIEIAEKNNIIPNKELIDIQLEIRHKEIEAQMQSSGYTIAQFLEMSGMSQESFDMQIKKELEQEVKALITEAIIIFHENITPSEENFDELANRLSIIKNVDVSQIKMELIKQYKKDIYVTHYSYVKFLKNKKGV